MVKWYHKSLPSLRRGFDSRYPLQIFQIFLDERAEYMLADYQTFRSSAAGIIFYLGR
jgi:hypothetical protein